MVGLSMVKGIQHVIILSGRRRLKFLPTARFGLMMLV
jgi:hypothetical protein